MSQWEPVTYMLEMITSLPDGFRDSFTLRSGKQAITFNSMPDEPLVYQAQTYYSEQEVRRLVKNNVRDTRILWKLLESGHFGEVDVDGVHLDGK